jgi:hypothetical protein
MLPLSPSPWHGQEAPSGHRKLCSAQPRSCVPFEVVSFLADVGSKPSALRPREVMLGGELSAALALSQ